MGPLAVLSDLHGNLTALKAVMRDVAARKAEQILVLGDLVGYLTRPNQVTAMVKQAGWPCLVGNYDLAALTGGKVGAEQYLKPGIGPLPRKIYDWTCRRLNNASKDFLAALPLRLEVDLPGCRLLAVHGSPASIRQYVYHDHPQDDLESWLRDEKVSVLCLGHTHRPFVRQVAGGMVVNPGSVGKSKDGDPRAAYGLIWPGDPPLAEIRRVSWDVAEEASRLTALGLAGRVDRLWAGT